MNSKTPIGRVFVANRGEIAVRIINACHKLGIAAVLGVSEADRDSMGARLADRVICLGPPRAAQSYLQSKTVIAAALGTGCDAVHPGYGFLSERAEFSQMCEQSGLVFIGPPPNAIASMGDKIRARTIAHQLDIQTVPGSGDVESAQQAVAVGQRLGYPLLLKAGAGGGGRGIRIVKTPDEMLGAFQSASAEALAAFGDGRLYVERYIKRARHIEIQIMADSQGNVVHLFERDCSVQRRHQKLIEEAPSVVIDASMRAVMAECSLRLARHVGYRGAGTVEFILNQDDGAFYFLEMNTRIQVEHPVTEMISGIDLVSEQIRVAGGEPLSFRQDDIKMEGHAIECRLNAEIPSKGFQPSPGLIAFWRAPSGEGVRVDSHCYSGYQVPPYYDSMLGKLIVHDATREAAIRKMSAALGNLEIRGIGTTVPFHRAVMDDAQFRAGSITTRWVENDFLPRAMMKDTRHDGSRLEAR